MLKIRLQRTGRKNRPFYRIVVAEHTTRAIGRFVERLGQYNPLATPKLFEVDEIKVAEWIKKGAQPSSTMARLLKGKGMTGMEKYIDPMTDQKKKKAPKEAPAAPAASTPAPAAPAAEPEAKTE